MNKSDYCDKCGKLPSEQEVYIVDGKKYCEKCKAEFHDGKSDIPPQSLIKNLLGSPGSQIDSDTGCALMRENGVWTLVIYTKPSADFSLGLNKYKLSESLFDGITIEAFANTIRDAAEKEDSFFEYEEVNRLAESGADDIKLISSIFIPGYSSDTPDSENTLQEAADSGNNTENNEPKNKPDNDQEDYIDDLSFIKELKHSESGAWEQYDILLDARIYGWQTIINWADYVAKADLEKLASITVASLGFDEIELIDKYEQSGTDILNFDGVSAERNSLSVAGTSRTLNSPVKIVWFNQTRRFRLFCLITDESLARRYIETLCRKSFGTDDEMKLARPHGKPQVDFDPPVSIDGQAIKIDTKLFFEWQEKCPDEQQYEFKGAVKLTEKTPVITLYEDGVRTAEYCLQTEENEDFSGKYFQISVRLGIMKSFDAPTAQIDGSISDTPEAREYETEDIGFRMEGHFLACGGEKSKTAYASIKGRDLVAKGLKYPGLTTTSNTRLIGICGECGKSFAFHGYSFYIAQSEPAYSDDGLDVLELYEPIKDKVNWNQVIQGKSYRYYNSFCCPHCGKPYIDYASYPEMKKFGVSGCCHIGRSVKYAKLENNEAKPENNEVKPGNNDLTDNIPAKAEDEVPKKGRKSLRISAGDNKARKKGRKKDKDKGKASKEGTLAERVFNAIDTKAMTAGMIACVLGLFLNIANLDSNSSPSFKLGIFSFSIFALGIIIWLSIILLEAKCNNELTVFFALTVISFAFTALSIHTIFTLIGLDASSKTLLRILALAGASIILGLIFHIVNKSKNDSISPLKVVKQDAISVKEVLVPEYSSYYKCNNRIIRVERDRIIQRYPEKSMEKQTTTNYGDVIAFHSWGFIWAFTIIPVFLFSVPALIYRMSINEDKDLSSARKKLIPYTVYSFVISAFSASLVFSEGFDFMGVIVLLITSPLLQFFAGIFSIFFYPKSRKKRLTKEEICRNLILNDKVTDINDIAGKIGISYSKALKLIENLIYDNKIHDAFVNYSGEEIIVKGITDKVAFKCKNCGGTSVFKMNETIKCKWCGADYD